MRWNIPECRSLDCRVITNALDRTPTVLVTQSDAPTSFESFLRGSSPPLFIFVVPQQASGPRPARRIVGIMAFGKKKEGLYLRPRVRRTTPLLDIGMAVLVGGVSGVYIFNDTFQRWQQAELALEQDQSAGKPVIPGNDQQRASDSA